MPVTAVWADDGGLLEHVGEGTPRTCAGEAEEEDAPGAGEGGEDRVQV